MPERPQPPAIIAKAVRKPFDENKVNRDKGKFASSPGATSQTAAAHAHMKKRPASPQLTGANVDALMRAEDKASGKQQKTVQDSAKNKTQYHTDYGGVLTGDMYKKAVELDKLSDDELEDRLFASYDDDDESATEVAEAVMQARKDRK